MPESPQLGLPDSVRRRLAANERAAAAQPGFAHPEADALAAFAEQSLSGAEREGVVAHLAACAQCREALALTVMFREETPDSAQVSAIAAAAEMPAPRRLPWLSSPRLRWAGLATSV